MKHRTIAEIIAVGLVLFAGSVLASYDCSGLPEWKRQAYYLVGAQVQYQEVAYENTGEPSKRDAPLAIRGVNLVPVHHQTTAEVVAGRILYPSTVPGIAATTIAPGPAYGTWSTSIFRTTG